MRLIIKCGMSLTFFFNPSLTLFSSSSWNSSFTRNIFCTSFTCYTFWISSFTFKVWCGFWFVSTIGSFFFRIGSFYCLIGSLFFFIGSLFFLIGSLFFLIGNFFFLIGSFYFFIGSFYSLIVISCFVFYFNFIFRRFFIGVVRDIAFTQATALNMRNSWSVQKFKWKKWFYSIGRDVNCFIPYGIWAHVGSIHSLVPPQHSW